MLKLVKKTSLTLFTVAVLSQIMSNTVQYCEKKCLARISNTTLHLEYQL
jgi:hypothetical protein